MFFLSPPDFFYFISGLCVLIITGFLAWALFEAARLLRQANQVVDKTRLTVDHLEQLTLAMSDKLTSAASYLGLLVEGGKQALSLFKKSKKGKKKGKDEEDDGE